MPKNQSQGPLIGAFSLMFGFGMVWYIWWLAIVSLLAIVVSVIIWSNTDDDEYIITAAEVK